MVSKIYEKDLYIPIKNYLEKHNYKVNGEVNSCDIVGIKNDELIIIELKLKINLALILQATERQKYADSVYVAILKPKKIQKSHKKIKHLLKRLEIGLIFVNLNSFSEKIEVILHPEKHKKINYRKKRRAILEEASSRAYDYNIGGSNKVSIMTSYKENAFFIACCLEKYGPMSAKEIKKYNTGEKTYSILYKNYYNWFEKVDKGIYKVKHFGINELKKYPKLKEYYMKKLDTNNI